jgi:hypothetical protein
MRRQEDNMRIFPKLHQIAVRLALAAAPALVGLGITGVPALEADYGFELAGPPDLAHGTAAILLATRRQGNRLQERKSTPSSGSIHRPKGHLNPSIAALR